MAPPAVLVLKRLADPDFSAGVDVARPHDDKFPGPHARQSLEFGFYALLMVSVVIVFGLVAPRRPEGFSAPAARDATVIVTSTVMNVPPHCQAIREDGPDGQVWPMALDLTGVACSLRLSFGAASTETESDEADRRILYVCDELRH